MGHSSIDVTFDVSTVTLMPRSEEEAVDLLETYLERVSGQACEVGRGP